MQGVELLGGQTGQRTVLVVVCQTKHVIAVSKSFRYPFHVSVYNLTRKIANDTLHNIIIYYLLWWLVCESNNAWNE